MTSAYWLVFFYFMFYQYIKKADVSAFFFNPNWDVLSTPLPGCLDEKNPLKFEITTFYNHLCNYVDRNYSLSSGGKALDA